MKKGKQKMNEMTLEELDKRIHEAIVKRLVRELMESVKRSLRRIEKDELSIQRKDR